MTNLTSLSRLLHMEAFFKKMKTITCEKNVRRRHYLCSSINYNDEITINPFLRNVVKLISLNILQNVAIYCI